jgi:probable phosphoglycerate mutase
MNDRLVVHCDGGARGNPGPAGIGAVVTDPSASPPAVVATVSESIGTATNNVAEYRALIAGVDAARRLGAREVEVRADSKLVVEQLAGRWRVKQAHLRPLHAQALELLGAFDRFELRHVPREQNADADALANAAMDAAAAR